MAEENPPYDRPLECSECKKPIKFRYTEIVGENVFRFHCCGDCPVLEKRLSGSKRLTQVYTQEVHAGLACGNCGTTLESVRMGAHLGCSSCYEVFDEVILAELLAAKRLPARVSPGKKSAPVHIGRAPGKIQEINPAMKLLALNEALADTLKREDYEQAALLRDQIKSLTEEEEMGKGKGKKND
ncbi:MAG: UvrB/UvrC motif-containing protein [Parachlamydiaceae bacterium]